MRPSGTSADNPHWRPRLRLLAWPSTWACSRQPSSWRWSRAPRRIR